MRQLVADKTALKNRDEEEIMGYRDVLNTIHESYEYIPIKPGYILQMHRDLFSYSEKGIGGRVQKYAKLYQCNRQEWKFFCIVYPAGSVYSKMGKFTKSDIMEMCPTLGKTSVESSIKKLVDNGELVKHGSGRSTFYTRSDAK